MQMKDKIQRNNHSKYFYYFKKIGIYSGAVVGVFVLFAIPVSIIRSMLRPVNIDNNELSTEKVDVKLEGNEELLKF